MDAARIHPVGGHGACGQAREEVEGGQTRGAYCRTGSLKARSSGEESRDGTMDKNEAPMRQGKGKREIWG